MFFSMYFSGFILFKKEHLIYSHALLFKLILTAAFGFMIYQILTVYFTQIPYIGSRFRFDFWRIESLRPPNHITIWSLPTIPLLYYAFFSKKRTNIFIKIIALFALFLIVKVNFDIATRTTLLLVALTLFALFLYDLFTRPYQYKFQFILFMSVLSFILYFIFLFDIFNLYSYYQNSNLFIRIQNLFNENVFDRIDRSIYSVINFNLSYFGGYKLSVIVGQIHNLWLDIYDSTGIIPFLFLCLFSYEVYKKVSKIVILNKMNPSLKIVILGFYFASFVQFSIEPIIVSSEEIFGFFLFVSGSINSISETTIISYKKKSDYLLFNNLGKS